jgi:rubrerythrin
MARASTTHRNGRDHSPGVRKSHDRQMPKSPADSRRQRSFSVNPEWLKDFLSEMLAVEMGGVKLYDKALNELQRPEHEDKLSQFLQQTERHVELCSEMLEAAGGDSNYQSPGAQAAEQKADGLRSAEVPAEMADLNNIENLVLAETKDHWNWETLASVVSKIGDPELKRMATKAISEVRKQEKMHLDWNEKTLSKLAMESAMRAPGEDMGESEADDGTEEEEMAADQEED